MITRSHSYLQTLREAAGPLEISVETWACYQRLPDLHKTANACTPASKTKLAPLTPARLLPDHVLTPTRLLPNSYRKKTLHSKSEASSRKIAKSDVDDACPQRRGPGVPGC